MKTYEKCYQKTLHYCLSRERLDEEIFKVITTLSKKEVSEWFGKSTFYIAYIVRMLGSVTVYQYSKATGKNYSLLLHQRPQYTKMYLWSDLLKITQIPEEDNLLALGLALLSTINRRQGIIWSVRLRTRIPDCVMGVEYPHHLKSLLFQIPEP